jgi:peroxin-10
MVFLATVFPYVWEKSNHLLSDWISYRIKYESDTMLSDGATGSNIDFAKLTQFLLRFHLALFYNAGAYLELSKRIARVRYIFTGGSNMERPTYRILGNLIFIQQFVSLCRYILKIIEAKRERQRRKQLLIQDGSISESRIFRIESEQEHRDEDISTSDNGKYRCSLCLSRRKQTTATSCGHMFCWKCITEWCANTSNSTSQSPTAKCPICRQEISMQTLARVYHYDQPI